MLEVLSAVDTTSVRGETSCLLVAGQDHYLWWMSIGDRALYLLHPEYARFGQHGVNQRSFFEWIGQVRTFREELPCSSTGTKRLRRGKNTILAVTDGALECGSRPFEHPRHLYDVTARSPDAGSFVEEILHIGAAEGGTDSATVAAWSSVCEDTGAFPSTWGG